ncbi:MAG: hypothetical protein QW514_02225 [Thermoprotei archaeon]
MRRLKDADSKPDEPCLQLIQGLLERVYSSGVDDAQKYLKGFAERNPLFGYDSVCMGFANSLLQSLAESNTDHAVVEAIVRGDRLWVEKCLESVRGAQEALYLPDEEYARLRVLEHALKCVLYFLDKGLKPKLGG